MRFKSLGTSGLKVSVVGLGCVSFGRRADEGGGRRLLTDEDATRTIRAALDAGVTLFDTSDTYGEAEVILGKAVAGCRDEVVIATKFGNRIRNLPDVDHGARASRRYIRTAVERSLRRLETDRIDLYQMHSPDGITPIEETLATLSDLVREGKVRYVGSSRLTAWQLTEAEWAARCGGFERFVSAQNHYSLLARGIENDIVPSAMRYGVGIIALRPLANGLLTGRYRRGDELGNRKRPHPALAQRSYDTIEALGSFANERGFDLTSVAIGGLLAMPGMTAVIPGATSPEQVRANVAAADWEPSDPDLDTLRRLTEHGPWPQDVAGSWPDVGTEWIGPVPPDCGVQRTGKSEKGNA
jgi:aryl-alcohol dehydrogenase-like predicted oxidoreductase